MGLPLTTHTSKLGCKLPHGNPLSVFYSAKARIVLHWVRLAGASQRLVVVAAPYKLHLVFICLVVCLAIEVSYQGCWHF